MAESSDDVVAALRCARHAKIVDEQGKVRIDIVPLFETLQALRSEPGDSALALGRPGLPRASQRRGVQEMMVGYSDSGKEVGLLAASAALRERKKRSPLSPPRQAFACAFSMVAARQSRAAAAPHSRPSRASRRERGRSIQGHRAGRSARPQIWPPRARATQPRADGRRGPLAHLGAQEQAPPATKSATPKSSKSSPTSDGSVYRALVWDNPRFAEFFFAATPLEEIAQLPIGSRPSKRQAGGLEVVARHPVGVRVDAKSSDRSGLVRRGFGARQRRRSPRRGGPCSPRCTKSGPSSAR